MSPQQFPPFQPHRLLRNGHAQTLAGLFLPWRRVEYRAVPHRVALPDGDALVLHDDCPASWRPGERVVLLMHGLAGCHLSPYMRRISSKLVDRGVRVFRMDLRGCGAGAGLARRPYHAGRSDDVLTVLEFILRRCPHSPIGVVGFSLSGNVVLKLLGEAPERLPPELDRALAVNPAIDLEACVRGLARGANRIYDRYFVRALDRRLRQFRRTIPEFEVPPAYGRPRRLFDFDDRYTSLVSGFRNALDYYARSSAAQFVSRIQVPTFILTSRDDPLVPVETFLGLNLPGAVSLHISEHGGHLGYVAREGVDPDRRWLDWRVVDWALVPR